VRRFRHTVGFDHRDTKHLFDLRRERRRQGRRAGSDETQEVCDVRSPFDFTRASTAWWIVGTAVYQLGRNSSIQPQNFAAEKPGAQTTLPPETIEASRAASNPCMWNSGMTLRQRSAASAREKPRYGAPRRRDSPASAAPAWGAPWFLRCGAAAQHPPAPARAPAPVRSEGCPPDRSFPLAPTKESSGGGGRTHGGVEAGFDDYRQWTKILQIKLELAWATGRI